MHDAICLASGGLDSVTCLHLLRAKEFSALPLFINYGQRNRLAEFEALQRSCALGGFPTPTVMDVSGFGEVVRSGLTDSSLKVLEDAFTPNRNLLFIVLAASVAYSRGVPNIVLGFLAEQTAIFPDQTDAFLGLAERAIGESLGADIKIICPLRDLRKHDVVALARELSVTHYYSCHVGDEKPCGRCIACLEYTEGN